MPLKMQPLTIKKNVCIEMVYEFRIIVWMKLLLIKKLMLSYKPWTHTL